MAKKPSNFDDGFGDDGFDDGFGEPTPKKALPKKVVADDGFGDEPLPKEPEPIKNVVWSVPKRQKNPKVDPATILGRFEYRGRHIIHTSDPKFIGGIKTYGFSMPTAFVVRDDFDDYCLPVGEDVFFTPYDAVAAIEMMDDILPTIRKGRFKKAESLEYAYREMRLHYRCFFRVYDTMKEIERLAFDADRLGENPSRDIIKKYMQLARFLNSNRRLIHT